MVGWRRGTEHPKSATSPFCFDRSLTLPARAPRHRRHGEMLHRSFWVSLSLALPWLRQAAASDVHVAMAACAPQRFRQIVAEQASNAHRLVRGVHPPARGVTISLRNNTVVAVADGRSAIKEIKAGRRESHVAFFRNLCERRTVPDCDVNINMYDVPEAGVFAFCRGAHGDASRPAHFVLPTSRFTLDEVYTVNGQRLPTYDDVLEAYAKEDATCFERKRPSAYLAVTPHAAKFPYIRLAMQTPRVHELDLYVLQTAPKLPGDMYRLLHERGMAGQQPASFGRHFAHQFVVATGGNTISDRLRLLLPLNAVVLMDNSTLAREQEFYYELLTPWVHFAPVTAANLMQTVRMLRQKPKLCQQIIANQHDFVRRTLRYDHLLDYVQALLWALFPPPIFDAQACRLLQRRGGQRADCSRVGKCPRFGSLLKAGNAACAEPGVPPAEREPRVRPPAGNAQAPLRRFLGLTVART